jgi:methylated-DNA-[protein]-cysteine S-methyltransferase
MYWFKEMPSPVGRLTLIATSRGLVGVLWENERPGRVKLEPRTRDDVHPTLLAAEIQLQEYFAGERTSFDLPLAFEGTEFQKQVWSALLDIPYGETRSYMEIATSLQNPKAVRAVGAANGRNPLSIVAPCHRVIAASGDLTGFAGGLEAKEFLLRLESRLSK